MRQFPNNTLPSFIVALGLIVAPAAVDAALVGAQAPPDIAIDPTFATVSGTNYFAETDLAAGTLKASSTDPSGVGTAGPIVQSTIAIEFENVSGRILDFPAASVVLAVNAAYSQAYDSNIGSPTDGTNFLLAQLVVGNDTVTTQAQAAHDVAHEFSTEGVKSLIRNDLLPAVSNGGDVIENFATAEGLLVDLLSGPLSIAPGENLVISVTLQAIAGADPNLTFVTNAADTAFLSFTLPQGVSIEDLAADTTAELTWVTPVPVPPAIWLFGSALGFIGWLKRRGA